MASRDVLNWSFKRCVRYFHIGFDIFFCQFLLPFTGGWRIGCPKIKLATQSASRNVNMCFRLYCSRLRSHALECKLSERKLAELFDTGFEPENSPSGPSEGFSSSLVDGHYMALYHDQCSTPQIAGCHCRSQAGSWQLGYDLENTRNE